jgi:hypothetical protein
MSEALGSGHEVHWFGNVAMRHNRTHAPQKIPPLFNNLVGAAEERGRHREAKHLGSLEVHDELVLVRCLHRKVGWLLALENTIYVVRCAAILVERIGTIRSQASISDEVWPGIDRWQLVLGSELDDQIAMDECQRACRHDQFHQHREC